MKLYQKITIAAITAAGLVAGGMELYQSGLEQGLQKGIDQGRAEMKEAVITEMKGSVGGLRTRKFKEPDTEGRIAESEWFIKRLQSCDNNLYIIGMDVLEDFYLERYHKRDN